MAITWDDGAGAVFPIDRRPTLRVGLPMNSACRTADSTITKPKSLFQTGRARLLAVAGGQRTVVEALFYARQIGQSFDLELVDSNEIHVGICLGCHGHHEVEACIRKLRNIVGRVLIEAAVIDAPYIRDQTDLEIRSRHRAAGSTGVGTVQPAATRITSAKSVVK